MASTHDIYNEIGEFGPYQFVICLLLALSMIPTAYSNLNTVFITGVPKFWCGGLSNELVERDWCEFSITNKTLLLNVTEDVCDEGYIFDKHEFGKTATTEVSHYRYSGNRQIMLPGTFENINKLREYWTN